jgi:hypothetical protein
MPPPSTARTGEHVLPANLVAQRHRIAYRSSALSALAFREFIWLETSSLGTILKRFASGIEV